jgi:hypothetical protein
MLLIPGKPNYNHEFDGKITPMLCQIVGQARKKLLGIV